MIAPYLLPALALSLSLSWIVCLAPAAGEDAAGKHPLTVEDLFALGRVSAPQVAPDGGRVAYAVTTFDLEKNAQGSDIWVVPLAGGEAVRMTTSAAEDSYPRWSPDGKSIAFISERSGKPQVWMLPADGGEARQVTDLPTGARGVEWSPDGRFLLFASSVLPKAEEGAAAKAREGTKARLIDTLLYRPWNEWREGKYSHLFRVSVNGGEAQDLTPGARDVPPVSLGSSHDFAVSPDGKEICFVMNTDPMVAISTNNDLFLMPASGGEPRRISDNAANDNQPRYSPDGRFIAYRAMARPGFESDRFRLMVYDRRTGATTNLTESLDYSVGEIAWAPGGESIFFTAADRGAASIFRIPSQGGAAEKVIERSVNDGLALAPDGTLVFRHQAMDFPYELFRAAPDGSGAVQLTFTNAKLLARIEMNRPEEFQFTGAKEEPVHGYLLKPPGFDPGRKWPLVYLIHGGPQGAWEDEFHYRWNAQLFAAPGYVVAMVNFHGSTGYGQNFTDAVSRDWGGAPFFDLMKGIDYLAATYPFIDPERMAAAGASYGGYMVNWIAVHEHPFKCLVSHAGVFDLVSKYGATDELWFPEWEFGGPPWENPEEYRKWSPSTYAARLHAPMLVIHGENDFRISYTQALQLFTALQRQNIPSKLLIFPDEDHFVQKPKNARLWWTTVYDWLAGYL